MKTDTYNEHKAAMEKLFDQQFTLENHIKRAKTDLRVN